MNTSNRIYDFHFEFDFNQSIVEEEVKVKRTFTCTHYFR